MNTRSKVLGVSLLLLSATSYGIYEGVKHSPSHYLLDEVGEVSLSTDDDILKEEDNDNQEAVKEPSVVPEVPVPNVKPSVVVDSKSSTSPIDSAKDQPKPVVEPSENGTAPTKQITSSTPVVTVPNVAPLPQPEKSDPSAIPASTDAPKSVTPPPAKKAPDTSVASSFGLQKVQNLDAANKVDIYVDNNSSTSRPKTFVEGEDPEYISKLWNSSIAIKHRSTWNLAPKGDPSWEKQVALVKKRFHKHESYYNKGYMDALVFGHFAVDRKYQTTPYSSRGYGVAYLDADNLEAACKFNLSRTPYGTWWSGARTRYWEILFDFCAKEDARKTGAPANYWYLSLGTRPESYFDEDVAVRKHAGKHTWV